MDEHEQTFLVKLSETLEREPLSADSPLHAQEWDSVVVLSVIALIDETFNVTVPVKDLQAIESVPGLFGLIRAETPSGEPTA